jgi:hypothetical protein
MIIAVDFDGTIVEQDYPNIGREIPFAIIALRKLMEQGHRLILWTCRSGKELNDAIEFCKSKGVEFYAVNENYPGEPCDENTSRKIKADLFIDDKNYGSIPDWNIILNVISNGEPNFRAYRRRGLVGRILA